jgi:hypothetical protein
VMTLIADLLDALKKVTELSNDRLCNENSSSLLGIAVCLRAKNSVNCNFRSTLI